MIIDTNNNLSRYEIMTMFSLLRKKVHHMVFHDTSEIKFFTPKNSFVLRYYTDADFLLRRLCKISGFKLQELNDPKNNNNIAKPIIWSIMSTYGHTNPEITAAFKLNPRTSGLTNYYRDKTKDMMKTHPTAVYLYEKIVKVLEKDQEIFDESI